METATAEPIDGVPITGILGDQQAALVGQTCFRPGEAKNTYGTGCFLLLNTGESAVRSTHGLLTTVAYRFGSEPARYALEGSIAVTGALVQWIRDNLGLIQSSPEIETLARTVPDNGGVYFVPAFSGLYAPHWNDGARGTIVGLTRFAHRGHIARAVLEATAFQTWEVLQAMEQDSGVSLETLRVDGGMTDDELLMQFQADIVNRAVVRPTIKETTALGAAFAAGLAIGVFSDLDDLRSRWGESRRWQPHMEDDVPAADAAAMDEGRRAGRWTGCEEQGSHVASPVFGEFVGTFILILLGDGVVAGVLLKRSKGENAGWLAITAGWALRRVRRRVHGDRVRQQRRASESGGDARCGRVERRLQQGRCPTRVAQLAGAFLGAVVVWIHYLPALGVDRRQGPEARDVLHHPRRPAPRREPDERGHRDVRADAGGGRHLLGARVSATGLAAGVGPFLVGCLVWGIGLSLGGTTGYAINPARDLGPRLAHAVLPIPGKRDSDWGYAAIPVVGPLIGAALAGLVVAAVGF